MGREYHCQQVIVLQPFETRTPLLQLAQLFVGNALFQASMMLPYPVMFLSSCGRNKKRKNI